MSALTLPDSLSANLQLTQPTSAECQKIWTLIHPSWGDSLDLPQFLDESSYLLTVPLARDGGMTNWILVDKSLPADERRILASCETYKKRALLARPDEEVRDVVIHGIASVFCDPEHRGHGYPQRMLRDLAEALKTWQVNDGETCVGSVLYSDIGKDYYAKLGWAPVGHNTHLSIPAKKRADSWNFENGTVVLDANLADLCGRDEASLRKWLAESAQDGLMVLPDEDHMRWHHAKEDFICEKLFSQKCPSKGVMTRSQANENGTWAIWTRRFYGNRETARKENTLYILRLVIENQNPDEEAMTELRKSLEEVLQAAQAEAANWELSTVKLWDPSPLVLDLIQRIDVEYNLVERQQDGIASLKWHGNGAVPSWVVNEKYAWL
ncbi:hypothetical protein VTL71DRAFT_14952 [Oculimacula yallundae]|uniref:LYC1 C-terminal domain-containing protein n=1 Tax=Oculimacula yallundae TaxID=86028 RepID=A0ABR4CF93_9HELO